MRRSTVDIEAYRGNIVCIKVPLDNGAFWQKEYNKTDTIGQVVIDFKNDNHIDIPSDYFMDWNCKNRPIEMTDKIESLLRYQTPTVSLTPHLKKKPLTLNDRELSADIVGKPFNNPFEVYTFRKKDKILKIQAYPNDSFFNSGLSDFDTTSAYCNGENHLYISGGETASYEINDKLWDIDLEKKEINGPIKIGPKKDHSMIFIPNQYVFLVGGNDTKTYYYDIVSGEAFEWADLNIERSEPALERIGTNLFCFDNLNKINRDALSFEKTELNSDMPSWDLIYPRLDPSIGNQNFNQKFYGVAKDFDNNIIFLGGNIDDERFAGNLMNYKYNPYNNIIESSNIPYKQFGFKEKTFLPYNKNIDFLFPEFNRQHPEVVFFVKNRGKLEKMNFKKNANDNTIETNINLRAKNRNPYYNTKYNFNMPKINIPEPITDPLQGNIQLKVEEPKFIIRDNESKGPLININQPETKIDVIQPEIHQPEIDYSLKDKINNIKAVKYDINPPEVPTINIEQPKVNVELPKANMELPDANIETKIDIPKTERLNVHESVNPYLEVNYNQNPINVEIDNNPKISKVKKKIPLPKNNYDLSHTPRLGRSYRFNSPGNDLINIPRFHVQVNEPGNELNISRKGKLSHSQFLTSPIDLGASANVGVIKDDMNLVKYNVSTNLVGNTPNPNFANIEYSGNIPGIETKNKNIKIATPNPEINLPNANIEVNAPKYDLDTGVNLRGPNVKLPNASINAQAPKLNVNSGDINLKTSNLNIPDYKVSGNIPGASIRGPDINLPSGNIKTSNINIPNANVNLKTPSYQGNYNLNGVIPGNANINYRGPNINVKGPKINQNDFYLEGNIPGKDIKDLKVKVDPINNTYELTGIIPGYRSKSPRVDYRGPCINANLPNANANLRTPRIKVPNAEIHGNMPGVNLKGSNLNLPNANLKVKGPNINGPDYKLSGSIPGADIKAPSASVNVNGPKINAPDYNLHGVVPGARIDSGNINLQGPNVNLQSPQLNVKGPNAKINIPDYKINSPEIKVENPNINLRGKPPGVNIDLPNAQLKGKVDGEIPRAQGEIVVPNYKITAPNIKQSQLDYNPNLRIEGNINQPRINTKDEFELVGIIPGKSKVKIPNSSMNMSYKINNNINPSTDLTYRRKFHGNIDDPEYNAHCLMKGSRLAIRSESIKDPNMEFKVGKINRDNRYDIKVNENVKIEDPLSYGGKVKLETPANVKMSGIIQGNDYNNQGQDIHIDVGNPEINVNGKVKNPSVNLNVNGPEINAKVNNPSINYNIIGPEVNTYEIKPENNNNIINIDTNLPSVPKTNLEISEPIFTMKNNNMNLGGSGVVIENKKYELVNPSININTGYEDTNDKNRNVTNLRFKPISGEVNVNPVIEVNTDQKKYKNNNENDMEINMAVPQSLKFSTNRVNRGLPSVGVKNTNFKASRVSLAKDFNAGNIDVNNMVSANVGVNGVKISNRIIE